MIVSNTASANGGGVYAENSAPTLRGSVIRGNQASGGGGVYMLSSLGGLTDNEISANRASEASGGGVLLDRSAPTVDRNRLAGNSAALDGGAVAIVGRYCASEVCERAAVPSMLRIRSWSATMRRARAPACTSMLAPAQIWSTTRW